MYVIVSYLQVVRFGQRQTRIWTRFQMMPNCDSIITVNLKVRYKTFETINPDVCDSYTSPSGKTWTTTNTYLDTIPNDANCDSIITVNLTVRYKSFATISDDVCDSYTSPSGKDLDNEQHVFRTRLANDCGL